MNERLNELAEQATNTQYGVYDGFDRVTFDRDKFAELIVRECANYAFSDDQERAAMLKHFGA
jgi:hypothetical protein